jgi:peptide/nickel transport system substrate-binding protein
MSAADQSVSLKTGGEVENNFIKLNGRDSVKKFKPALVIMMVLVLALSLLAAGCGGNDQQAAEKRDSITIAIPSEPSSMDVQFPDDGNMRLVTENVTEGLLAMDGKTLKPVPCLATEYKNTGASTWNVKLREGVQFHNGNPFNADDVIFSVKRILDPDFKSDIVGFFQSIKDVKKISDYEVEFTTEGSDPSFPTRLTLLKMMDKETVEAAPDKVKTELIGTGPYKLVSWERGQNIVIERNDQYWGAKPAIKTAKFRFIEEDATRAAALKAGEVDLSTNMLPEYVKDLPKVKTIDGLEFSLVRMNAIRGVMKDPRIRQAACYAINYDAIAQSLYQGYASVAPGQVFKPGYAGFNANLKPYPYDVNKAKELLQQAGYKGEKIEFVGERGRWLKDGEQIETIAQMLREAGFNVEVKMLSFQNWLRVLFNREQAPDMIFTFHSNDIFDADRTFSTYVLTKGPGSSYPDTLDQKVEQARTELDTAKRQQLYEEIGQKIYDDPAWISIVNIKDIYGMKDYVEWEPRQDMRLTIYEMTLQ